MSALPVRRKPREKVWVMGTEEEGAVILIDDDSGQEVWIADARRRPKDVVIKGKTVKRYEVELELVRREPDHDVVKVGADKQIRVRRQKYDEPPEPEPTAAAEKELAA